MDNLDRVMCVAKTETLNNETVVVSSRVPIIRMSYLYHFSTQVSKPNCNVSCLNVYVKMVYDRKMKDTL